MTDAFRPRLPAQYSPEFEAILDAKWPDPVEEPEPVKPARRRRKPLPEWRKYGTPKEWAALSAQVRREQPFCAVCGSTDDLHADHILPKSKYPHLAFERLNLRTLCRTCNYSKAATLNF